MADQETPVKIYKTGCVICQDKCLNRAYKISGAKCKQESVVRKLALLTDKDIAFSDDASICRPCFIKLNNFYEFRNSAILSLESTTEGPYVQKRCHLSPPTPSEAVPELVNPVPKQPKKSRRRLPTSIVKPIEEDDLSGVSRLEPETEKMSSEQHIESILRKRGLQWNSDFSEQKTKGDHSALVKSIVSKEIISPHEFATAVTKCDTLYNAVKREILSEVHTSVNLLTKRSDPYKSVMTKYRGVENLDSTEDFLIELLVEINDRCPFLMDVLMTVMTGDYKVPTISMFGPLIASYAILVHSRDNNLSAFQRLITLACAKDHASDGLISRLNKLGITLSPTSKLNVLDTCGDVSRNHIVSALKSQPMVKITGDNLDVYVRTQHQTSTHSHQDLHMFTSNIIFPRVPLDDLSDEVPKLDLDAIFPENFILNQDETARLIYSYSVLVGRIFSQHLEQFKWMERVLPTHIHHTQTKAMKEKSLYFPLPIMMKNEAKYEECVDILDAYEEELCGLFTDAYGSPSLLDDKKVVIGGDQLTRVRLQGAKGLRDLAPDQRKSFKNLSPIVCEMWHVKQDLLHKAYKALWTRESHAQIGTLNYFKILLRKTDVNGNVKSNFKAHWEFLILVGTYMILEQALEYFGMDGIASVPTKNQLPQGIEDAKKGQQTAAAMDILGKFVRDNHYAEFDLEEHRVQEKFIVLGVNSEGNTIVVPYNEVFPTPKPDHLYNYCSNLCHWALHLMQMDDTAKEGDVDRVIINSKYNLPFFFSHSTRSKYFIENIDFVLKTEHLLSPQMEMRVLDGCFVNPKGGIGRNVEADLVQEHSVRNRKDMIRQLGANKTEKAIVRVTNAADAVSSMTHKLDTIIQVKTSGSRHTKFTSDADHKKIKRCLRVAKPFKKIPGRQCIGYNAIEESPFHKINKAEMKGFITRNIARLSHGQIVEADLEEEEDVQDGLPEL